MRVGGNGKMQAAFERSGVPSDLSIAAKYSANNVADAYRQLLAAEVEARYPKEQKEPSSDDEDEDDQIQGETAAEPAVEPLVATAAAASEGGDPALLAQIAELKAENDAIRGYLGKGEEAEAHQGNEAARLKEESTADAEVSGATGEAASTPSRAPMTLDTLPMFVPPSPNSLKMMEGGQLGEMMRLVWVYFRGVLIFFSFLLFRTHRWCCRGGRCGCPARR
jgi:hypothetical protein